jgi:putative aldouronate transport system permease protein
MNREDSDFDLLKSGKVFRRSFLRILKRDYFSKWQLYLFLLLPVVYIIIFAYFPMAGIQIAFKKFDFRLGIWNSPWVGLLYFKKFFQSYMFVRVFRNTIMISFYSLIAGFPMPIILALILNAFPHRKYKKIVQSVSYMPHFISTVVIVGMMLQLLNPRTGVIGTIYQLLTGDMIIDFFSKPAAFPHLYVWSGIWHGIGWGSIIYMAALSGIDPEMHESAEIDGATRFQRIIYIDLPGILPTATIMLIMNVGHIMNVGFEKAYLMQNTLNISTSEVISTYVYKVGLNIGTGDFSFATAIGLFNAVINLFLLIIVNYFAKKVSRTSLW